MKTAIKTIIFLAISLFFLNQSASVNLRIEDRYIQKNALASVNYSSCSGIEFHNSSDYEEYDADDPVCHFSRLKEDVKSFGVNSCCPFHGFIESATCDGSDKTGAPALFHPVEVCLQLGQTNQPTKRVSLKCPANCRVIHGFLSDGQLQNNTFTVEGKTFENFCLGIKCDNAGEKFEHWYEACGDCEDDVRGVNQELSTEYSAPLCCGPEGILHGRTMTCSAGTIRPKVLAAMNTTCHWTNKKRMEFTTKIPEKGAVCVSWTTEGERGGLLCKHECQGADNCIQLCMGQDDALDWRTNELKILPLGLDMNILLGVPPETMITVEGKQQCRATNATVYLYPEWRCSHNVNFLADGSLVKAGNTSEKLGYGEFCIDPLAGDTSRGGYRIKTCWQKEKKKDKDSLKDFTYYSVMMSISICCLLATIFVYCLFHNKLLHRFNNKVMINFASNLLIAFLTLVVQQNISETAKSPAVCIALTLTNQFFFHTTFSLMTLWSYNIFYQIYGTRNQKQTLSRERMLAIAYTIPAAVFFLTLIVELAAPQCAVLRPKIGMRSCHFYGGMDKFVWLYLPILVLLIVNTTMFIGIAVSIIKNTKQQDMKKKETIHKTLTYLKLFFGMGFVWYFEILAFALRSYNLNPKFFIVPDTLNMLQGVWVFLIFVCTKEVCQLVRNNKTGQQNSEVTSVAKVVELQLRPVMDQGPV